MKHNDPKAAGRAKYQQMRDVTCSGHSVSALVRGPSVSWEFARNRELSL